MKNKIITIILLACALSACLSLGAQVVPAGQWRLHNTFSYYVESSADTRDRTYILALGQVYNPDHASWNEFTGQLYVYDKDSGELTGYNTSNYLNGNIVRKIAYNKDKGYLLIVYGDYKIDLLYDDDTVYSIPGLSSSSAASSKNVNSVSFYPAGNKAYLATDFGYLVVDDDKKVISESRIYGRRLDGMARVGDRLFASTSDGLYESPAEGRHTDWEAFTRVPAAEGAGGEILPLSDSAFGLVTAGGVYYADAGTSGTVSLRRVAGGGVVFSTMARDGYFMNTYGSGLLLRPDGVIERIRVPQGHENEKFSSWDMSMFYFPVPWEGVQPVKYSAQNKTWEQRPVAGANSPRLFRAFTLDYNDKYGMMASNNTINRIHSQSNMAYWGLTSAYKDAQWTHYGMFGTQSPAPLNNIRETYGAVYDPALEDYIYMGSRRHGMYRVDLRDNSISLYTNSLHAGASVQGGHAVFPVSDKWTGYCDVSLPSFDADQTMWVAFNTCNITGDAAPLYYWSAADRRDDNVAGFKPVPVKDFHRASDIMAVCALRHPSNRGILVVCNQWAYEAGISIFNHGGTPGDTSDDKYDYITSFLDQDGNSVPLVYTNCLYEDMQTGRVWVGTSTGLFLFDPSQQISGGTLRVQRVKVARNDGTNLADYLLDGADVMDIKSDGAGRKWCATLGNGVVMTSSDGSRVLAQYTTENSLLPSDQVYQIGFDNGSNAVWMGTSHQIATFYTDATAARDDFEQVQIFPNPVRPDYTGEVTIRGLMDNSLVKIVDTSGGLVKELGLSNGGMITWDQTTHYGSRAASGVYYVTASSSGEQSEGYVGKILVVR